MVRAAALILALSLAGPAMAQTSSCQRVGADVVCTTDPAPGPYRAPQPYKFDNPMDAQARGVAVTQQLLRQQLERQVAAAIRDHRCSDAKDLALRDGALDLAEQAQRLCQ